MTKGEETWSVEVLEIEKERDPRTITNSRREASLQEAERLFLFADLCTTSHDMRREVKCCERRSTQPSDRRNLTFSTQNFHTTGSKIKSSDTHCRCVTQSVWPSQEKL